MVDLRKHIVNHLFNALACNRRSLVIVHAMLLSELLGLLRRHDGLIINIALVPSNDKGSVHMEILKLLAKAFDRLERIFARFVEHRNDTICSSKKLTGEIS